MGVAAAGLAFGRPQHSIAARPPSSKRRAIQTFNSDETRNNGNAPATPSPLSPPMSASTSRLRKRTSLARSLTSASGSRGGARTAGATPDANFGQEGDSLMAPGSSLHLRRSEQSLGRRSPLQGHLGTENAQPSWLHRKSTLSSLKSGSPAPTERPVSASLSYSNGSTAPMLPDFSNSSPSPATRNKLVKRSSSQRALQSSNGMYSTFRRPATSHQRSATLLRHFQEDEEPSNRRDSSPKAQDRVLDQPHDSFDDLMQVWRPFFRPQTIRHGKRSNSKKRNVLGTLGKEESIRSIVPDITELPTLVMATSISTRSSSETFPRVSNISALSRPFTPVGFDLSNTPDSGKAAKPMNSQSEPRARNSFSLSEMFPSPSPLTWKIPRTGSLRNKASLDRSTEGRRISSAPQTARARRMTASSHGTSVSNARARGSRRAETGLDSKKTPDTVDRFQIPSSSPLPPLNRLSVFEVDLPTTLPSYPASPQLEDSTTPSRIFSLNSSPSMSSQMKRSVNRDPSHRPSGAPSDFTSTVAESENDNSRIFSDNEEDADGRSETVYDSTRTGATGASLSGLKRPPIDTIFDESPSAEASGQEPNFLRFVPQDRTETSGQDKTRFGKLPANMTHQDLRSKGHDASTSTAFSNQVAPTPRPSKVPKTNMALSPATHSVEDKNSERLGEDVWAFNVDQDEKSQSREPSSALLARFDTSRGNVSTSSKSTPKRRQSPSNVASDRASKANIFEWSEQVDKEHSPGASPRPKTVDGRQIKDMRGSRFSGRRGPSALHLRSQSVPVPDDYRSHSNTSKLDSWVLGNKGPSEEWDGDFDFDEIPQNETRASSSNEPMRTSLSSGMLVPRAIMERQASVHGQFGQVKELTLLVEELKRLQQRANNLGIMSGQSSELWKEAEGIVDLATIEDDEQEFFPPRSPHSPGQFDFDASDDDSPLGRNRRHSGFSPPSQDTFSPGDDVNSSPSSRRSQEFAKFETPPPSMRPRKESSAKAKSVLETIHHQRSQYEPAILDAKLSHHKLPFDTTSLKDLVTRAGVVTRALKEIVRRAEGGSPTLAARPSTPKDPPLSQMFQQPPPPTGHNKSSQVAKSPKSPKSPKSSTFMGGSISGNDNDINGHMKMMTVV